MQFQLSKVFSAELVSFLWFIKNFVKKLSHFLKKLLWPGKCFEFLCHSFLSAQLYLKTNKNYEQLWKWNYQTPRVFTKKDVYFSTLRTKAINQLVFHQLYSKSHTKLLGCLSTVAIFVGIQKKLYFDQIMRFFGHFYPKNYHFEDKKPRY